MNKCFGMLKEATIEIIPSEELKVGDNIIFRDIDGLYISRCEVLYKTKDKRQTYPFIKVSRICGEVNKKTSLRKEPYYYRIKSCKEEILEIINGDMVVIGVEGWHDNSNDKEGLM